MFANTTISLDSITKTMEYQKPPSKILEKILVNPDHYFCYPEISKNDSKFEGVVLKRTPQNEIWEIKHEDPNFTDSLFDFTLTENLPLVLKQIKQIKFKENIKNLEEICHLLFTHLKTVLEDRTITYPAFFKGAFINTEKELIEERVVKVSLDIFSNGNIVLFYPKRLASKGASKEFYKAVWLNNLSRIGRLAMLNPQNLGVLADCNANEINYMLELKNKQFDRIPKFQSIVIYSSDVLSFSRMIIYGEKYQQDLQQFLCYINDQQVDFPIKARLNFVGQILNILDYLKENNIVHCDIKGENLLVTGLKIKPNLKYSQSKIVLCDWAFARKEDTLAPCIQGTWGNIDPAILINPSFYTPLNAHDIWSAGLVMWDIFFGLDYPIQDLFYREFSNEKSIFQNSSTLAFQAKVQYARLSKFKTPLAIFFQTTFHPDWNTRTPSKLIEIFNQINSLEDSEVIDQINEIGQEFYEKVSDAKKE